MFLEEGLRKSALADEHNFIRLMQEVLIEAGLTVEFAPTEYRRDTDALPITHMKAPIGPTGLVFRRVYHYPFWQIERTEKRWEWDVAHATFDPQLVDEQQAKRFQKFWRERLFPGLEVRQGDAIYMPLQGKISQQRSFQSCSPLQMVQSVLSATDREVNITLHPKESYSRAELDSLERLESQHSNVTIDVGGMDRYLPACYAVVTQNSSAAFNGYFFEKPAIIFGEIDFHHIAQRAKPSSIGEALKRVETASIDYEKYLWWFWQDQSINAGRPEAKNKIRARFQRFGWPVG